MWLAYGFGRSRKISATTPPPPLNLPGLQRSRKISATTPPPPPNLVGLRRSRKIGPPPKKKSWLRRWMEADIAKRVGAGWMNWKKCSGVLCDKRMPVKLKGKVYRTVVRPAMLYGAETLATTKRQESRIEVNEMMMLRWMCGVTRKDKIRNEHIRGTTKVVQASRKITERRLKWYGHVMRMEEDHVVRRVMTKAIPGKRKRGWPKTRWKDVYKRDMQTVGLREDDE